MHPFEHRAGPLLPHAFTVLAIGVAVSVDTRPLGAQIAPDTPPTFELDATWPKPLPNNWMFGAIWGAAVDSRDHIWVIHKNECNACQPRLRSIPGGCPGPRRPGWRTRRASVDDPSPNCSMSSWRANWTVRDSMRPPSASVPTIERVGSPAV